MIQSVCSHLLRHSTHASSHLKQQEARVSQRLLAGKPSGCKLQPWCIFRCHAMCRPCMHMSLLHQTCRELLLWLCVAFVLISLCEFCSVFECLAAETPGGFAMQRPLTHPASHIRSEHTMSWCTLQCDAARCAAFCCVFSSPPLVPNLKQSCSGATVAMLFQAACMDIITSSWQNDLQQFLYQGAMARQKLCIVLGLQWEDLLFVLLSSAGVLLVPRLLFHNSWSDCCLMANEKILYQTYGALIIICSAHVSSVVGPSYAGWTRQNSF